MAIGVASDFKIYQEEFYGGVYESVTQNTSAFNAASAGTLRLVAKALKGDYEKEAFLKLVNGLIVRRDTTSVAGVTDKAMAHGENVAVKVNRRIGPVAETLDKWRKIGSDAREFSFKLGKMVGEQKTMDYVNTAVAVVEAAVTGVTAMNKAVAGTITAGGLVDGLALMGDQSANVKAWVMHSKPAHDLLKDAITQKIFGVANIAIYQGTTGSLGRPIIMLDAPALLESGTPNVYPVLGLTEAAVTITESEQEEIFSEVVTGLEQLVMRVQGEYAFNVECKGFTWDVANGGANPTDAALATSTNWDKTATSDKSIAGVRCTFQ